MQPSERVEWVSVHTMGMRAPGVVHIDIAKLAINEPRFCVYCVSQTGQSLYRDCTFSTKPSPFVVFFFGVSLKQLDVVHVCCNSCRSQVEGVEVTGGC